LVSQPLSGIGSQKPIATFDCDADADADSDNVFSSRFERLTSQSPTGFAGGYLLTG